jgi:signal transduction histidine kinase
MTFKPAILVAVAGMAGTAIVSWAFHMPMHDALDLAWIAGRAALLAGVVGALVLIALRRRPIGVQVTVVALATVGAVAVGSQAAADAMFIEGHDADAMLVILFAAGTVGAVVALVLGQRVEASRRALGEAARRIGSGAPPAPVTGATTGEFASLARDLEEMSRRLDEARERERAAEASRRELTAWVSHDLRTPLAGIRAMAEALEDGVVSSPDAVLRYHHTLRRETERLAHLVDELFELSVINAGALRLHMERVSLWDLVSDAVAAASPTGTARGIRIEGQLHDVPPELELSPPEVIRVLRNLLENAIRHTPSDGTVWVETGMDEGEAYVSVADQCGGIPESDLPRVFDPAFRGERARTPEATVNGGLGLAIARGIVEAHRGDISVRNEGPGCRFTVRLPVTPSRV